jgi:O-antigen/teichoic acid export membrane protein
MRSHITNAICGAIDYLAYPLGMLLLAPPILQALGIERYGIWILANATLSTGAILASGFGDANIQIAATALGTDQHETLLSTVRSALGIHVVLGSIGALTGWLLAPILAHFAAKNNFALISDCIWSLRITAALIFIRAIETVCISTQRAFSRYGSAIQISVVARILSLIAACMVSFYSHTVWAVMASALVISVIAIFIQFHQLHRLLNTTNLKPHFHRRSTKVLLRFGAFTWLQAASGLLFGQIDRIIAAVVFGAAATASYTFCVQLAMPIYGLAAAGLHFLFPLLASQQSSLSAARARRSVLTALSANIAFVFIALLALLLFGRTVLRVWGGPLIASAGEHLLPSVAWGSALSALAVTGCYSMLAIGKPQVVSFLNLAGGLIMLGAMALLIPRHGIAGVAYGRLFFGPVLMLIYFPLFNNLKRLSGQSMPSAAVPIYEDA